MGKKEIKLKLFIGGTFYKWILYSKEPQVGDKLATHITYLEDVSYFKIISKELKSDGTRFYYEIHLEGIKDIL